MEFEVRHLGGIRNCFVSLPFPLIQTIESSCPPNASLPNPLVLEIRSSSPTSSLRPWTVSWSGATSSSPNSVEIAAQFADCISLPDRTNVRVRVISFVPIAERVVIEPVSEDDWEVVEHKSGLAENTMLQQVRIIGANMRFPLWLHGDTVTTYKVLETVPEYDIVQLAPGCEVAVAPKQRLKARKSDDSLSVNALLRLQDCDERLVSKADVNGVDIDIALTTVAYLHPQTAEKFSLTASQQVVIVPKVSLKSLPKVDESDPSKTKFAYKVDESNPRHSLVCLLFSDSVGKGHIMISHSLRLYLRAPLHSWVYVMRQNIDPVESVSVLSLSRCLMKSKVTEKSTKSISIDDESVHSSSPETVSSSGSSSSQIESSPTMGEDATASSFEGSSLVNGDEFPSLHTGKRLKKLVVFWFRAQCRAIKSMPSAGIYTLVLPKETVLHFRLNQHHNEFLEENIWSFFGPAQELTLLLTINEKPEHEDEILCYDIDFDENKKDFLIPGGFLSSLKMGNPINLDFQQEEDAISRFPGDVSSLSWMGEATIDVINRLKLLLSPELGLQLSSYKLPLAGHILIYGPHGSGKTILAQGVAKSLQNCKDILAHIVFIKCSLLSIEKKSHIRHLISGYISEAIDHAPSLVIFDDLDSILPSPNSSDGSPPMTEDGALATIFVDLIDEFAEIRERSCGFGPIAILATAQTLESLPQQLTSSGRLDFHIQLPVPATSQRSAILKHEIKKRSLECSDDVLLGVASKCDGYDAHDLEMLIDRTVHAAIGRFLPSSSHAEGHELNEDDFSRAMNGFIPVSMRDVTKSSNEIGRSGWDDVGGLTDIRKSIKEMIELPSKFPEIFAQSPLRMRSNVLLYGPPGCGKTHIVGAAAAACSLRFISVKGPELLNKYIGASEQAVRNIFSKAAAAAPCLLFFDEFESIAPKRGHDNTGVTDRVVNQFLTELDGVEVLAGVFVFAATSRPDLLDAALLRPGRLDRLLFCDFPSRHERLDILELPLASDVKMEKIADMSEGFSGADLQALLSDAQLAAVHEHLNSVDSSNPEALPVINSALLISVASKARPSISDSERKRLNAIYSQFLDSKKSVTSLTRDAKGKRATLA